MTHVDTGGESLPQVGICFRQGGRLKNGQHAKHPMSCNDSHVAFESLTNLSPEDGDDWVGFHDLALVLMPID